MVNETNETSAQSSDRSFYLIILALIVGMGFYISYDMDQRYGSTAGTAAGTEGSQPVEAAETATPVIVGIEKVETVIIKPVAEIPATETTPEAVVVKKIVQETTVTTLVIPVAEEKAAPETAQLPVAVETEAEVKPAPEVAPALDAEPAPAPVVTAPPAPQKVMENMADKMDNTMLQATDSIANVMAAPVTNPADAAEIVAESVPDAAQPIQAFNPYDRPYQDNYYAPQRPYGSSYKNRNRSRSSPYRYNPYRNNPFRNSPYRNRYDYNPYPQPAAPAAE